MSLLLDALKKAAEKKAQKDAENKSVENTEVLTRTEVSDRTLVDETHVDKTEALTETRLDTTKIDATELDHTELEATQLDHTELEATQLDSTRQDSVAADTDTTIKTESTQVDPASQESTLELDIRELDLSKLSTDDQSETDSNKDFPVSGDDGPGSDVTKLDATQIDATELNPTRVDHTQLDRTVSDTTLKIDPAQVDTTKLSKPKSETTQELDISGLDLSQLSAEENQALLDSAADETISFIDEGDAPDDEIEDETIALTPDDITEFLGDGHSHSKQKKAPVEPPSVRPQVSDDTTLTNPDSLSLTDIEQDDMDLQPMVDAEDSTETATARYSSSGGEMSLQPPLQESSSLDHLNEDERMTVMNTESTTSSVDIEKLTNDETVTIKDSTFTRTFAPDNYDRTLMKLTDNDVSRIFPGMRSESDTVMTPDYAKKIFLTKSRGVKNYYYKVYTGIALCILLGVVIWGLFEIQSESDSIDNNLISLKRDPMPGTIKPKDQPEPVDLFSSSTQVDNKAIKLIETANTVDEGDSGGSQQADSATTPEDKKDTSMMAAQDESENQVVASIDSQAQKSTPVKTESSSVKKQAPVQPKQAPLSISSNNRVSEKDQLLAKAYAAYEAGDIDNARKQYQQVIALDPENRDALLGSAAIHVFDNQFEKAISLYQKLLLANPKDDLAMTSLISVANVDPEAGETEIKRLLNELPDSPYLHFALGNMLGSQNRWSEAQNEYFKALQYKPKDPNYAYNMAISLEHMEKPASAVTFYQRAIENKAYGLATFSEPLVMQRIEVLSQ